MRITRRQLRRLILKEVRLLAEEKYTPPYQFIFYTGEEDRNRSDVPDYYTDIEDTIEEITEEAKYTERYFPAGHLIGIFDSKGTIISLGEQTSDEEAKEVWKEQNS